MKNIQKTNEICYCLGGKFKTIGGEISPPKGPEKNTVYNSGTTRATDRKWRKKSLQQYSFDGKVTIRSDMTIPKKKSCCPTLLLSTRLLSLNLPSIS